jgi:hypothetical protein
MVVAHAARVLALTLSAPFELASMEPGLCTTPLFKTARLIDPLVRRPESTETSSVGGCRKLVNWLPVQ